MSGLWISTSEHKPSNFGTILLALKYKTDKELHYNYNYNYEYHYDNADDHDYDHDYIYLSRYEISNLYVARVGHINYKVLSVSPKIISKILQLTQRNPTTSVRMDTHHIYRPPSTNSISVHYKDAHGSH